MKTLLVRYPDGDDVKWLWESKSLRVNAMNGGRLGQTPGWHENCALLDWPDECRQRRILPDLEEVLE